MQIRIIVIGLFISLYITGCSNTKPLANAPYSDYHKYMKTEKAFHDITLAAVDRSEVAKNAKHSQDKDFLIEQPFYLVSIEKVNNKRAGLVKYGNCATGDNYCLNTGASYFSSDDERKKIKQDIEETLAPSKLANIVKGAKTMIISHVTNFFEEPGTQKWNHCFLYNIYHNDNLCAQNTSQYTDNTQSYYEHSWDVIDALKQEIDQRINSLNPTHLIFYSTGWNTAQWESIQNYRDLANSLLQASVEDGANNFKPLFIGISWPSYVSEGFWAPIFGGKLDLTFKAKDADEIGLIYGNLILNKIMLPLAHDHSLKTVLIGHSLGGRIVSSTVNASPLLQASNQAFKQADLTIGLQSAFSVNRMVDGVGEKPSNYRDFSLFSKHAFMTSSRYDAANDTPAKAKIPYIGSMISVDLTRKKTEYRGIFDYLTLDYNGIPYPPYNKTNIDCTDKVTITDASNIVNQVAPGTGGWAHSDIYDLEMGRFIWQTIKTCAP